jgi:hypothetical protein
MPLWPARNTLRFFSLAFIKKLFYNLIYYPCHKHIKKSYSRARLCKIKMNIFIKNTILVINEDINY